MVFFALLYGFFFIKYLRQHSWCYFIVAMVVGVMGYLVKATSMLPVDILIGSILIFYIFNRGVYSSSNGISHISIKSPTTMLAIFFLVAVPILIGIAWVSYADNIKMAAGQDWLTSNGLMAFNFGTISQRFDATTWRIILFRMPSIICMTVLVVMLLLKSENQRSKNDRFVFGILLIATFATIIVFMSLYLVHDYYLIALCPYICMGGG